MVDELVDGLLEVLVDEVLVDGALVEGALVVEPVGATPSEDCARRIRSSAWAVFAW